LYSRGLELQDVDVDAVIAHTEGASPAYVKELLRKAVVLAASAGAAPRVSGAHLQAAMDELSTGGELAQRILGYRPTDQPPAPSPSGSGGVAAVPHTGFPSGGLWITPQR
jgi:hypothetical protein